MPPFLFDHVEDLSRLRPRPREFSPRPSYCMSTVIFLDFDGVLHREDGLAEKPILFDELDRLEAILDDFPQVSIAFSTSWQMLSPHERLKSVFRPEYRSRVEGGTAMFVPDGYTKRALLAETWMARCGNGRRWISLDDDARAFPYREDRLLWCSEAHGFGQQEADLLRVWLEGRSDGIQDLIARRVPAEARYWTARDAIAVAHESDGWVDVSKVPVEIRAALLPRAHNEFGDTWPLKDWAMALTAWRKWGMNPLWTELRDEARCGPPLP